MIVQLTNDEQIAITKDGLHRALEYRPQWEGRTFKRNYQHDREQLNFAEFVVQQSQAIAAEVAVSKYFRQPYEFGNKNYKNKADVGHKFEVKWTKWVDGSLILTEQDRKEDIAILVTGSMPKLKVCGWIPIVMAQRNKQQRSDGSWWIGQHDLHPMADLLRSQYGTGN